MFLAACPRSLALLHVGPLAIPGHTPPCVRADPQPSAPSPRCLPLLPKAVLAPTLTWTYQVSEPPAPMVETPALPPGAWGPWAGLWVRHWRECTPRILVLVELSMVQAQLSAEVDAAPGQGAGVLVWSPLFPWGGVPVPTCVTSHGSNRQKQLDSVMPATLCNCRAQSKLFSGCQRL